MIWVRPNDLSFIIINSHFSNLNNSLNLDSSIQRNPWLRINKLLLRLCLTSYIHEFTFSLFYFMIIIWIYLMDDWLDVFYTSIFYCCFSFVVKDDDKGEDEDDWSHYETNKWCFKPMTFFVTRISISSMLPLLFMKRM